MSNGDKGKEPVKSDDTVKLKGKVVIANDRGQRTEIDNPEVRRKEVRGV